MDTRRALHASPTQKMNPYLFFHWRLTTLFTWLKYRQPKTVMAVTMWSQENHKNLKKEAKAGATILAATVMTLKATTNLMVVAKKKRVAEKADAKRATTLILTTKSI